MKIRKSFIGVFLAAFLVGFAFVFLVGKIFVPKAVLPEISSENFQTVKKISSLEKIVVVEDWNYEEKYLP